MKNVAGGCIILNKTKNMKNIYYFKNEDTYYIQKTIWGKRYYYGRFKTLEEAIKYRDYLESTDWSIKPKSIQTVNETKNWANSPRYHIAKMFNIQPEEIP